MDTPVPVIAGAIATVIFVGSYLPMLLKAGRTRDLRSYSLGQLALANVGNVIQSIYVLHLPFGPIWLLHGFYLGSTALMLLWYLRYSGGHHGQGRFEEHVPARARNNELVAAARAG